MTKNTVVTMLSALALSAVLSTAASAGAVSKQSFTEIDAFGNRVTKTRIMKVDDFGNVTRGVKVSKTDVFGNRVSKSKFVGTDAFGNSVVRTKTTVDPFGPGKFTSTNVSLRPF